MRLARAIPLTALVATAALSLVPGVAHARMRSTVLERNLCETVGGGRFVDIPGFPGERIDRRLLRDIRWMRRNFNIFITDGYSTDPVHAPSGEHPIGLALDIVPQPGRRWGSIARLAHWAEPTQNHPRPPFRWVGWNGDPGHGRGDHLHLSWMHSPAEFGHPARRVYTRRCPDAPADAEAERSGDGTGGTRTGSGDGGTGGISSKLERRLAPAVPESDGADYAAR